MKFNKEVQIALAGIAGIVVLFFGLQFLKGHSLMSNEKTFYVTFSDVSGLSKSSPIYANGFRVGTVNDILYNYKDASTIVAVVGLAPEMNVPKGSRAEIESDLLGNVKLNLILGANPIANLSAGDTIKGGLATGVLGEAGNIIPQVQQIMPKLDSIMSAINMLLHSAALQNSLNNIETITSNLTQTTAQLNSTMQVLNSRFPEMMAKADSTLSNTQAVTKKLSNIDVAYTMAKVNATLANVEQATKALNGTEGTLGLLMHDRTLYDNLTSTMAHADSLVTDLKANPKRYVHFSVFGRKSNK